MFLFLSHPLDPRDLAWPGEPTVKVRQCTDITDDCPFCSFISEVPNHCGTHMDAPRHFVKDGLGINELPIEYFCHRDVVLLEIPKGRAEGITREDLEPHGNVLSKVTFALIRTGFERYRRENPKVYQNEGPYIAPSAGDYLTDNFPNLKGIGMDFLAIGSPSPAVPRGELPHGHRGHAPVRIAEREKDFQIYQCPAAYSGIGLQPGRLYCRVGGLSPDGFQYQFALKEMLSALGPPYRGAERSGAFRLS